MSPEIITSIGSMILAIVTGAALILEKLRGTDPAWVSSLEKRIDDLESMVNEQHEQLSSLERWKIAARAYISVLRGILADQGMPSPEPPVELEL